MVAARKKGLKAKLVPAQVNDEGDIQRTLDELLDHFRNAEVFVSPANDMAPDMIWKMFDVEGQDMGVTEYKNKYLYSLVVSSICGREQKVKINRKSFDLFHHMMELFCLI